MSTKGPSGGDPSIQAALPNFSSALSSSSRAREAYIAFRAHERRVVSLRSAIPVTRVFLRNVSAICAPYPLHIAFDFANCNLREWHGKN
ncbi:hypothetical protein WOLCODRAFT_151631 [Wolfiporia cocos MD-104 SS10]|uniref:Uncharacterized protein n=1 Tax=Wolfiporia cocos (strain MD-104) TaxID=742152 RepID=A0A2H3JXY2_WOLCO|nr:hypothetical protein WOLCODRAFT_151631 [Wolfiporia cocos MD-104 SS10]